MCCAAINELCKAANIFTFATVEPRRSKLNRKLSAELYKCISFFRCVAAALLDRIECPLFEQSAFSSIVSVTGCEVRYRGRCKLHCCLATDKVR